MVQDHPIGYSDWVTFPVYFPEVSGFLLVLRLFGPTLLGLQHPHLEFHQAVGVEAEVFALTSIAHFVSAQIHLARLGEGPDLRVPHCILLQNVDQAPVGHRMRHSHCCLLLLSETAQSQNTLPFSLLAGNEPCLLITKTAGFSWS